MTCKDCYGCEICAEFGSEHLPSDLDSKYFEYKDIDNVEQECSCFKEKTRFVELPCKVGETVHYITFWNNKYDYHFITNVSYDILYQLLHEKEIGYVVFMTDEKPKAEAKLKELNKCL